jgi:hypothetical protein
MEGIADRSGTDVQNGGDFSVGRPLGDETDHLQLPRGHHEQAIVVVIRVCPNAPVP